MTNFVHGLGDTAEFRVWANIKQRCFNPNNPGYKNYGARGITVCDRWKDSFENFYADMGPRPSDQHSLDRYPNNDGNYEPGNCRWATEAEQQNNKRSNVYYTFQNELITETELSKRTNLPVGMIRYRVQNGFTIDEIVNIGSAPATKLRFTHNGETKSLREWAEFFEMRYITLYMRLFKYGFTFEEAISTRMKK